MMPLRAAMPSTVMKPTSEPSDSTPPASNAPATPPIDAHGRLRKINSPVRTESKTAWSSRKIASTEIKPATKSRCRPCCSSAYSPRTSG